MLLGDGEAVQRQKEAKGVRGRGDGGQRELTGSRPPERGALTSWGWAPLEAEQLCPFSLFLCYRPEKIARMVCLMNVLHKDKLCCLSSGHAGTGKRWPKKLLLMRKKRMRGAGGTGEQGA